MTLPTSARDAALAAGYSFRWEDDWDLGGLTHLQFYGEAYDHLPGGEPSTCEYATLLNPDGYVVAGLGCIDDATDAYRSQIEDELASEVFPS